MFGKKYKFTEADLDKMIQEAMMKGPESKGVKPNFLEFLKSKRGLRRNERITT